MSWLIIGAGGMLGTDLTAVLRRAGADVLSLIHDDLDIRDERRVREVISAERPSTVVNCAGWTAVDEAEQNEAVVEAVNGTAVLGLASACREAGSTLVQMSTDYVFDGSRTSPYPEDAPPSPISAYGRSKLIGEQAVLATGAGYVLRTAWLYGAHGNNFVRTMMRLARERDTVQVVDDQVGQPTWCTDLAERIRLLVDSGPRFGVYHATSTGSTSWYGLAREVFGKLGLDPDRVRPTTSAKFPRPAKRPANSVLGHDRWAAAGLPPMRHWREALDAAWPFLVDAAII